MKVIEIDPGMTIDEMEQVTLEVLDLNLATIAANDDFMFSHDVSRGMSKPFNLGPSDSYERTIIITYLPMGPFSHGYVDSLVKRSPRRHPAAADDSRASARPEDEKIATGFPLCHGV